MNSKRRMRREKCERNFFNSLHYDKMLKKKENQIINEMRPIIKEFLKEVGLNRKIEIIMKIQ